METNMPQALLATYVAETTMAQAFPTIPTSSLIGVNVKLTPRGAQKEEASPNATASADQMHAAKTGRSNIHKRNVRGR